MHGNTKAPRENFIFHYAKQRISLSVTYLALSVYLRMYIYVCVYIYVYGHAPMYVHSIIIKLDYVCIVSDAPIELYCVHMYEL